MMDAYRRLVTTVPRSGGEGSRQYSATLPLPPCTLLLALSALLFATCAMLRADVVTLQPAAEGGKDSFVAQMNGGMNYGSNTALASGQGPDFGGGEKRAFVQFDLSSIPTGATINSATLSLYVNSAAGGGQTEA